MVEIISVRFKEGGKQYYFNPNGQQFQVGDGVIVDTTRGTEYGLCTHGNSMIDEIELMAPLRPVVRKATQEDKLTLERNKEKEKKAFAICQEKIAQHGLDMKLVEAEYSFEGNKVLFFFTSDGRVDFRALVKDLAGTIHARIELRQIGVRDEARMLGGLGICGKPFCCHQFLDEFQPVSIKMAKTQNLSLNPTKISGTCGRLMCCLKYEQDAYEDAVKRCPRQDSFVECPDGVGNITAVNLLREQVKVRLESSDEQPKTYRACEIRVVRSGKGKRPEDYVAPPKAELEKLRFVDPDADRRPRKLGDMDDLSLRLEQYLGDSKEAAQEEKKSGGRRRHRGGRGKGGAGQAPAPEAQAPARREKPPVKAQPPRQKPAPQPQAQKPKPAPAGESRAPAEGEKKPNPRRRHRPRRRGPKPEGGSPAPQQ